ncbi:MAG: response regulator [Calditrichaeota bacterium]|nr:response regulator [Calditrichota bacterium]
MLYAQTNTFNFLKLEKPISQNTGVCIFQDHMGFIWIGTTNGLNRYDGSKVVIYENDPADSTSISDNYIRKIAEDNKGNLWIATENGLNKYDRLHDRFIRYFSSAEDPHSLLNNNISDVLVDNAGKVWVAATDLHLFNPKTDNFERFHTGTLKTDPNRDPYHNFIYQDLKGIIWFGYWNQLYRFNNSKNRLDIFIDGEQQALGEEGWHFHELVQDQDSLYWLATNKAGLINFRDDPQAVKPQRFRDQIDKNEYFSDYRILALYIDHQDYLWVSCENAGLVVLDQQRDIRYRLRNDPGNERSVSGNSVWSIIEDNQNRLWFGIWNAGINYIDPYNVSFKHYFSTKSTSSLSSNIVTDFIEDKSGNLWIATDGGGLNYFDRKKNTFSSYIHDPADPKSISSNAVLSLCYDDQGRLWAGTWNGGINIFDSDRNGFLHLNIKNSGLSSDDIFDLLNDGRGNILIATYRGGVDVYNPEKKTWKNFTSNPADPNSLSGNNIFNLYKDKKGNLWIGSLTDGLNLMQTEHDSITFTRYQYNQSVKNGISDNRIHALFEDHRGRFWVGTSNGLDLMNRGDETFLTLQRKDGLISEYISGISEDTNGFLWVSSLKGLTRIDSTLSDFHHYDVADNLQGYHFNKNSVYKTASGELLFGGTNGFNIFRPEDVKINPHPPKLVFTDLKVFNQSVEIGPNSILKEDISVIKHITLSYKHSVFSIEFVALNFTHPEKNQYAYKMEGFDDKWIYSGIQQNATFTNLDAGDYIFYVKAANNDGIWNEQGIALGITITPPFWKTRLAYILYVVLVSIIFYMIMRYRLARQKLRYDLEVEHLKLEKLSELDKVKSRFFSNVSHEIRTPIMLIVGPLQNLLNSEKVAENVKSKINLIIRNAQRLQRLLSQLVDFYKIETPDLNLNLVKNDLVEFVYNIYLSFKEYARQHQIEFNFSTNMNYGLTWFDPDILDKIAYNFLSNAFKFTSDGGKVTLGVNFLSSETGEQNIIEIFVQDNGIGIPKDQLQNIFERFYQVETDAAHSSQGIGIGLHMTKELAELLHGEIRVDSEPGTGTVFRVLLPAEVLELERKTQDNLSPVEPAPVNDFRTDLKTENGNTALILFVEDEKDVQQYITDILGDRFKIITADNGREGYEKARKFIPDIVISDIVMPEMDGFELCGKLKSEEETSHIPVILLTVQSAEKQKVKGIKLGADAYLPKPFNSEELSARVSNLLKRQQKLREQLRRQILLEPEDSNVMSLDEKFLVRVKQEVEKNLSDWKLDANVLSDMVGISRIQLYRKLKGLTGQTVHEFIRTIRLRRAVQLLEQRKMKITEIAYHVGFNDLNYFTRCFRKEYGSAPSEYLSSLKSPASKK